MPRLYLIPTPIAPDQGQVLGYLAPLLEVLEVFLVEHPKTARRFIRSLCPTKDLNALQLFVLDKRTTRAELYQFLETLPQDVRVGVLSEAGCPGIADPGALAVAYAHQHGWEVVPLVGPSSILLALMASGLNGQGFSFHGYLPIKETERLQSIQKLERTSAKNGYAQLFIETPYRNQALFGLLLRSLAPTTRLCVAADIGATSALIRTRSVAQWKNETSPEIHKRPAIFILQA
ncbi:MAG: SAM-dependent methyltransferase [Bernardetiaceae bacterium]